MNKILLISFLISCGFAAPCKLYARQDSPPDSRSNSRSNFSSNKKDNEIYKSSSPIPIAQLKEKISNRMEKIDTVSFNFNQKTYMAKSTQTVEATVHFRRPEDLILKYRRPDVQEIYISSASLFTYIPSIKQATKQSRKGDSDISNMAGITLSVIFSEDSFKYLKKEFHLKAFEFKDYLMMQAEPIADAEYEMMEIYFSKEDYYPVKTIVEADNFKSVTTFNGYDSNREYKKNFFKFNPGKEINLIEIN
ncbi:MAG: outer-membrane lipoprotein carrier protein LolA [Elusimicrobia bacterium]|nr:outer-membrane lipoprotein carrier protein LolA [Elusimicrobiota bacterium]